MNTIQPTLSVVIVNSDGTEDTMACLESLFRSPPDAPFEVIVVDNCSRTPCLPLVQQAYPQVQTIMAPQRQGFARNYNLGMCHAHGHYVLIINNDTVVHPGALDHMLAFVRQHPTCGMAGPKLVSPNGRIQSVCVRPLPGPGSYIARQLLIDPALPGGKLWERFLQWRAARRTSGSTPAISGACMLVPRETLQHIGMLDEGFDFYYEDIEWCHRVQCYNKQVSYVAEAVITHFGDHSLSKVRAWAKKSEYRSAIRYFRHYHHLSAGMLRLLWLVTVVSYFLRGLTFLLIEGGQRMPESRETRGYARVYFYLWHWILQQRPWHEQEQPRKP